MVVRWLTIPLILGMLGGCGSSNAPAGGVRGRVLVGGLPLSGGMVVFAPDESRGNRGHLGTAGIERDGWYTIPASAGLNAGWHRIAIAGPTTVSWRLPEEFRNPELSGLEREIKAGAENVVDIEIAIDDDGRGTSIIRTGSGAGSGGGGAGRHPWETSGN